MDVKAKTSPTALQRAEFQERRVALRKKLVRFRELQVSYMPGLRSVLSNPEILDDSSEARVESTRLYFASELSMTQRARACAVGISEAEEEVRLADVSEALEALRRHLRTRTFLNKWRIKNISGQRPSTRARALQDRVDVKVHAAKMRYRHSRMAYLALHGPGEWARGFRELRDEDVRSMNERELTKREMEKRDEALRARARRDEAQRDQELRGGGILVEDVVSVNEDQDSRDGVPLAGPRGDGHRKLSWIWYTVNLEEAEDSPGMHEGMPDLVYSFSSLLIGPAAALRVEWAKSKARALRWWEEVVLLSEEMRRVIAYSQAKRLEWQSIAEQRSINEPGMDTMLREGIAAYAYEHAAMEERIAKDLEKKWEKTRLRAENVIAGRMEVAEEAERLLECTKDTVELDVYLEEEDYAPVDDEDY